MNEKAAAFFDLDYTICKSDAGVMFVLELLKQHKISFKRSLALYLTICRYHLKLVRDLAKMRHNLFYTVFKDSSCVTMIELYRDYFNKVLSQYIHNDVFPLILNHKAMNRDIWIISASFDFIIKPFAEYLRIDKYLTSSTEVKNGKFTGYLLNDIYQSKQEVVKNLAKKYGYDLNLCYAYTDSIFDQNMLSSVGHPVAVNPDKQLRKLAQQQGWTIEEWR